MVDIGQPSARLHGHVKDLAASLGGAGRDSRRRESSSVARSVLVARAKRRVRLWCSRGTHACILASLCINCTLADSLLTRDEDSERVLVELVEVAFFYDTYNERCRGFGVSAKLRDIDEIIYPKYRVLVGDVMERYIARTRIEAEQKLRADYFSRLETLGGCEQAEASGLERDLAARYRELLGRLRTSQ